MKIKDGNEQKYKEWLAKNTDGYGRACFVFAEAWAGLLEAKIIQYDLPEDVIEKYADKYSNIADDIAGGITGFMYGAAVSILSQCWEYGDIIRKWHNRKYGRSDEEDDGGVVNPAVMTVG